MGRERDICVRSCNVLNADLGMTEGMSLVKPSLTKCGKRLSLLAFTELQWKVN